MPSLSGQPYFWIFAGDFWNTMFLLIVLTSLLFFERLLSRVTELDQRPLRNIFIVKLLDFEADRELVSTS